MKESKLPPQLTWREFVRVLEALGYQAMKSKRGSARSFHSKTRSPAVVTFHEPHGKDPIRENPPRVSPQTSIRAGRVSGITGERLKLRPHRNSPHHYPT